MAALGSARFRAPLGVHHLGLDGVAVTMADPTTELERYRAILTEEQYDLAKIALRFIDEAKARWMAEVARLAQSATAPEELRRLGHQALARELARAKLEIAAVHVAHAELLKGRG